MYSPRPALRSGFTLVEVMIAVVILVLASGSLISSLVTSRNLNALLDERTVAREAADSMIERMKARDFAQVVALFNDSADDDPVGEVAPGSAFRVGGLAARVDDADELPGEVLFPELERELREDFVEADLGMPRDLDFDGVIDSEDHAADYRAVLTQTLVMGFAMSDRVSRAPEDGALLLAAVPRTIAIGVVATFVLLVPLTIAVGILTTFPVVGPLHRFRQHLRRVADGERPGPCPTRQSEELYDLCELINAAVATLQEAAPTSESRAADEAEVRRWAS